MADDIEFVDGLLVKAPHEKAPSFVKAQISIKREALIQWLQGKSEEWLNLDVKESKGGKYYAAVSNYKPKPKDDEPKDGPKGRNDMTKKADDEPEIPF
jgi:hypothetical protein